MIFILFQRQLLLLLLERALSKMPEVIKVAQIIEKEPNGGLESFLMNYYKNIDRFKIQFHFYIQSASKLIDPNKIEQIGEKVFIISKCFHFIKYIKFLKYKFLKEHYKMFDTHYFACSKIAGRFLFGNKDFNNGKVKINFDVIINLSYNIKNQSKQSTSTCFDLVLS